MDTIHIHKYSSKVNNEVFLLLIPPFVFSLIVATYVLLTLPTKTPELAGIKVQNQAVLGEKLDSEISD